LGRRCEKFWHRRGAIIHYCGVQIDPDALPNDPTALQKMLRELYAENDKLQLLIERLTRHQFGRRSEQLTIEQLQLGLEDQEQTAAEQEASQDALALVQIADRRTVPAH
jgi:transposase